MDVQGVQVNQVIHDVFLFFLLELHLFGHCFFNLFRTLQFLDFCHQFLIADFQVLDFGAELLPDLTVFLLDAFQASFHSHDLFLQNSILVHVLLELQFHSLLEVDLPFTDVCFPRKLD